MVFAYPTFSEESHNSGSFLIPSPQTGNVNMEVTGMPSGDDLVTSGQRNERF